MLDNNYWSVPDYLHLSGQLRSNVRLLVQHYVDDHGGKIIEVWLESYRIIHLSTNSEANAAPKISTAPITPAVVIGSINTKTESKIAIAGSM